MAVQRMVNGVDLGRLIAVRHAIEGDPNRARLQFRARTRWAGNGAHCYTTIQDFLVAGEEDTSRPKPFVLNAGEPDVLLGENEGPNATEAALHALASCLNTTFIYHAAAHGVRVEELEIDIEGNLDLRGFLGMAEEVRNGYEDIQVTFKVKADAPEEKVKELCELAQKRAPVFDIVTHAVPVSARVEVKGVEMELEAPVEPSI